MSVSVVIGYKCNNCESNMFPSYKYCPNCGSPAHWEKYGNVEAPAEKDVFVLGFPVTKCIRNRNKNDAFKVGEYYPVMGYNNGVQIVGKRLEYGGDAVVATCMTNGCTNIWEGTDDGVEFEGYYKVYLYKQEENDMAEE